MKLSDAIFAIVADANQSITPQDIRARIKQDFPVLYATDAAKRSVEAGHYEDIDHALLAAIYTGFETTTDTLSIGQRNPIAYQSNRAKLSKMRWSHPQVKTPRKLLDLCMCLALVYSPRTENGS